MTLREYIKPVLESHIPLYVRNGSGSEVKVAAHKWQLERERKLAWAADKKIKNVIVYRDRVVVDVI